MKRIVIIVLIFFTASHISGQQINVKNNLIYNFTSTPNMGIEFGLSERVSFNLSAGYNPFEFSNHKRFKHWLIQPEYRYWFCEKFNGNFLGIHLHGGEFSIASLKLPFGIMSQLENHKYEGYFFGGGVNFGHQWILNRKWSVEAVIGVGYARIETDKYKCGECGEKLRSSTYNYFGPTKASVSIIYFIK